MRILSIVIWVTIMVTTGQTIFAEISQGVLNIERVRRELAIESNLDYKPSKAFKRYLKQNKIKCVDCVLFGKKACPSCKLKKSKGKTCAKSKTGPCNTCKIKKAKCPSCKVLKNKKCKACKTIKNKCKSCAVFGKKACPKSSLKKPKCSSCAKSKKGKCPSCKVKKAKKPKKGCCGGC